MGACVSKPPNNNQNTSLVNDTVSNGENETPQNDSTLLLLQEISMGSLANSSSTSMPMRFFKNPFPPSSPAKHIKALLTRRVGSVKPNEAPIPEEKEVVVLDKNFGFLKHFGNMYEVGRGHLGYTCVAKHKKGELKGEKVAVKVRPKAKV